MILHYAIGSSSGNRSRAFSLVEVVISIGIVGFVILAILGLLSLGLQTSRESSKDTALALATQQVDAWSRSQPFSLLSSIAGSSSNTVFFFNAEGNLVRTESGSPVTESDGNSLYSCEVSAHESSVSPHFIQLRYRFEWPLSAPAETRKQRVVVASRSNEH